jgi:3-methyladenine DNA glycosylase AlkC
VKAYSWEWPFSEALGQGDLVSAVKTFHEMDGTENRRHLRDTGIRRALALLQEHVPDPEQRWSWGVRLIEDHLNTTLGVRLVITHFSDRPDDVVALWLRLAEPRDWERREDAAWMLSELLVADFDDVYARCLEWVHHSSQNVRRAVVVGVKVAAKARVPEWGERFLDLFEPLLNDRSVYVRKNLGPFAVGDGLLRCYPELTLKRLAAWAKRSDEQTRWNVAMVFSAAEAAKHVGAALPILTELAADERRFVWRAVASAMRNLGRRRYTQVVPILKGWLHDEQRRRVAEVALRYVEGDMHR